MTTQLRAEEKQIRLFEEYLAQAELPVRMLQAELAETMVLEVTLEVSDVADWQLRHAVLAVANEIERDANLTVVCFFRAR